MRETLQFRTHVVPCLFFRDKLLGRSLLSPTQKPPVFLPDSVIHTTVVSNQQALI